MASNTKLTSYQKTRLGVLRTLQNSPNFVVLQTRNKTITAAVQYICGHNCAKIVVSVASPDETKARKKVGEYLVRENMREGAYIPYPVDTFGETAEDIGRYFMEVNFGELLPVIL